MSNNNSNKEIKTSFMPKIKRVPKAFLFNNKMSSNLTKYLFNFFDYKQVYEMGKIDLFFMNNVIDYIHESEPWPEKVKKLKAKYNFQIFQNEVDCSLEEAKINKRRYKFPSEENKCVNYYQFDKDGDRYISIARTFDWAHKNNELYWGEEKLEGSYEKNQGVPYLRTVCWIDTNFSFLHVKPNNYKLYINENFVTGKRFKEQVTLKVIIDDNIIIYEIAFPDNAIFSSNNNEKNNSKLKEDFICLIKKEDFDNAKKDENEECKIKIQFNQINNYWKGGWFIDGGSLIEITQKEMDEEIELINKKKEEEEKKRLFYFYHEDKKEENEDDLL
jgi:hypothetical protein